MKKTRNMLAAAVIGAAFFVLAGCGAGGGEPFRIVSGSENQELEAVLEACERATGVDIEMSYQG